jgi:hypothetical protein
MAGCGWGIKRPLNITATSYIKVFLRGNATGIFSAEGLEEILGNQLGTCAGEKIQFAIFVILTAR